MVAHGSPPGGVRTAQRAARLRASGLEDRGHKLARCSATACMGKTRTATREQPELRTCLVHLALGGSVRAPRTRDDSTKPEAAAGRRKLPVLDRSTANLGALATNASFFLRAAITSQRPRLVAVVVPVFASAYRRIVSSVSHLTVPTREQQVHKQGGSRWFSIRTPCQRSAKQWQVSARSCAILAGHVDVVVEVEVEVVEVGRRRPGARIAAHTAAPHWPGQCM